MAIKANLVIDQGEDFSALIDLTDADDNVFDLTDYTVASEMRKNYAQATPAATFSASHNGQNGQILLELDSNVTKELEPGRYLYDVEIKAPQPLETISRVVQGIVTVTPGVTRSL